MVPDVPDVGAGLGPRPTRLHHDPTTQLSAARSGVLDALSRSRESVTVHQLAQTLGQHSNTVREHLDALVEAGLAVRESGAPVGRGRPHIYYRALPPEESRPQIREYATLASVLAAQLARVSRDPAGDALAAGHLWGQQLGAVGPAGDEGARARSLTVLGNLGFDPVELPDGDVDLRSCPMLEAARANPTIVCGVHLGLVQGLYLAHEGSADQVTLEPFARFGACLLRLPGGGGVVGKDAGPPQITGSG